MAFLYQPSGGDDQKVVRKASFADVFKLISEFRHGTTVKDICLRNRPERTLGVDIFRLVQYLVLKGIIRRLHRYPVHMRFDAMFRDRGGGSFNNNGVASNAANSAGEDAMYKM